MKKRVFLILMLCFIILNCQKGNSDSADDLKNFSIVEFKNWNPDKQVKFINSLTTTLKFEFLKQLLPNSEFNCSPSDVIKFSKDGGAIVYSYTDDMKGAYTKAYWKIENNSLILWKKEKKNPFPYNSEKEILTDFTVEKTNDSTGTLHFEFSIKESDEKEFLTYQKYDSPIFDKINK